VAEQTLATAEQQLVNARYDYQLARRTCSRLSGGTCDGATAWVGRAAGCGGLTDVDRTTSAPAPYTTLCMALLMLLVGAFASVSMSTDIFPTTNIRSSRSCGRTTACRPSDGRADHHDQRASVYDGRGGHEHMNPNRSTTSPSSGSTSSHRATWRRHRPDCEYLTGDSAAVSAWYDRPVCHPVQCHGRADPRSRHLQRERERAGTQRQRQQFRPAVPGDGPGREPAAGVRRPRSRLTSTRSRIVEAKGLSPIDVSNAINVQNIILPSGTEKMGTREYQVASTPAPTS